jgi:uncharacterized protein (TIGR03083 family)
MTDRAAVMDALHAASDRFITMVESLDPSDAGRPVPNLDWNVAETVAHVLTVVRRGFADRRRSETAAATADLNQIVLDETPERDLATLAQLLSKDVHTALDVVYPKIPEDRVFPFHAGVTTTMTPALRIVLGEFLVHGHDVARAADRPWEITGDEALLLAGNELLGAWVRPDAPTERYELRLGAYPPELAPGRLSPTGNEPDVVIESDAVDFVLSFYGRTPTTDEGMVRLTSRFVPS